MKFKAWMIVVAIAVIGFGAKWISSMNGPDDRTLIRRALSDAQKASREGRPGGVMELLSAHIKINSDSPGNETQIAKWIKDGHPDVRITQIDPLVEGDRATIVSPASVSFDMSHFGHFDRQFPSVTLVFRKEDDHEWIVIPVKKWKLVDAVLPASDIPEGLGN